MFKCFLALFAVLLLLCPNLAGASNQLVASGVCTQANMRLSATTGGATASGGAFIDFTAASVLTAHIGKLLIVRDSLGRTIQGWIKKAGTSESVGETNLVTSWTNQAEAWETFTSNGVTISEAANTSGAARALSNSFTLSVGALCKTTLDVVINSGGAATSPFTTIFADSAGATQASTVRKNIISTTSYAFYGTYTSSAFKWNAIRSESSVVNCSVNNYFFSQVLTPSATGVTIVSLKGGVLYNWSAKNTAFNYNDAAGYTYRIYKTPPVLVAGPTAVTAANAQYSLVDPAFFYAVGVDLTAYQTDKHLIAFYDATGLLIAMGYCSATPPAGEGLDAELISDPEFDTDGSWTKGTNWTIAGGKANAAAVSGYTSIYRNQSIVSGALYKGVLICDSLTGGNYQQYVANVAVKNGVHTTTGTKTDYITAIAITGSFGIRDYGSALTATFTSISGKKVLDPPSTGLRIVNNDKVTQTWVKTGTGALNAAITYKIYATD